MHTRTGTLYSRSDRFDHFLKLLRDTVAPAAEREADFNGMLVTNNRRSGKVVGITLWESEVQMLASAEGEYLQDLVSRVIIHLRRPPSSRTTK